jgi:ornithine--oxo-acid transaminase
MTNKLTHQNIIGLGPPFCLSETDLLFAIKIIGQVLTEIVPMKISDIPGVD